MFNEATFRDMIRNDRRSIYRNVASLDILVHEV